MTEITIDPDALLAQFNKLMQELLRGTMNRNCFRPWEIDLLLDIESCNLRESNRREILRRYQKAVQRQFDRGSNSVLKLSEYLTGHHKRVKGVAFNGLDGDSAQQRSRAAQAPAKDAAAPDRDAQAPAREAHAHGGDGSRPTTPRGTAAGPAEFSYAKRGLAAASPGQRPALKSLALRAGDVGD
jgi:hypothetical protein